MLLLIAFIIKIFPPCFLPICVGPILVTRIGPILATRSGPILGQSWQQPWPILGANIGNHGSAIWRPISVPYGAQCWANIGNQDLANIATGCGPILGQSWQQPWPISGAYITNHGSAIWRPIYIKNLF